jgi:hypothetical protein
MALGQKAGSQWCSIGGVESDPKTLIIGDTNLKDTARNPDLVSLREDDQLIAVWDGKLQHIRPFFEQRPHTYRFVENIVLLGYGMEDLSRTGLDGIQHEGTDKDVFMDEYINLISYIHDKYPDATVISSDPIPRQTSGYGNARLAYFASRFGKGNPRHHHINLAKCYYMHRSRLIKESKYQDDGILVKQDQAKVLINMVHEALDKIEGATTDVGRTPLTENGFVLKF